jgi:hypothetical protein
MPGTASSSGCSGGPGCRWPVVPCRRSLIRRTGGEYRWPQYYHR